MKRVPVKPRPGQLLVDPKRRLVYGRVAAVLRDGHVRLDPERLGLVFVPRDDWERLQEDGRAFVDDASAAGFRWVAWAVRRSARVGRQRPPANAGDTIRKVHKGREIVVTISGAGFEYGGETYSSLSAVARAIVGYSISGPAFFREGTR